MVQDQRIVAPSAPRCIGNTLLLHGRTYSPPYVVSAIGNADRMQNALSSERGVAIYRQYVTRFGLGYRVQPPIRAHRPRLLRLTRGEERDCAAQVAV